MNRLVRAAGCGLVAGIGFGLGCSGDSDPVQPTPPPVCTAPIAITVTGDTVPVFSWTPNCAIGRIIVEHGFDEYWGAETCGENITTSPLTYGQDVPRQCPEEPAIPLTPGFVYRVSAWTFITVMPESLALVGEQMFTYLDSIPPP